jgi:phosphopantothenoylcysteine decarboxylase/phosphopantothenate--cysteine ligase
VGSEDSYRPASEIRGSRGERLRGVDVVHCICGSIAAVESPRVARELIREGAEVWPVMTPSAKKLVGEDALYWATGNRPVTELTGALEHVALLKKPRPLVLIAPATANTLAKIAAGIDDTPVTSVASVALGLGVPVLAAPAMHEPMYRNRFVAEAMRRLEEAGVAFIEPRHEEEKAKMAEPPRILEAVLEALNPPLRGRKLLITAGPTLEHIDPVRVITNRSSGLMGLELAREARRRGAEVTLILGATYLEPPAGVRVIRALSTEEMERALASELASQPYDAVLAAAAPADFRPSRPRGRKVESRHGGMELRLVPTPKVIGGVKKIRPGALLVAFKAEVDEGELEERARLPIEEHGADMVVANLVAEGYGMGEARQRGFILDRQGNKVPFDVDKATLARMILDIVQERLRA